MITIIYYRESKFHGSLKQVEAETSETSNIIAMKPEPEQGTLHPDSQLHFSGTVQELSNGLCEHVHQESTEKLQDHSGPSEGNSIATNHIPVRQTSEASIGQTDNHIDCDSSCTQTVSTHGPVCILCDEPATVRLLPCGHEIICLMCSKRAKKCLQCKVHYVTG